MAQEEVDPDVTYRGHTNVVTSVAVSAEQNRVYSADPSLNMATYVGHTDAIWDFKLFPISREDSCLLASASADGTVKLWDTQTSGNLLKSSWNYNGCIPEDSFDQLRTDQYPAPTSLDFCHTDLNKIAVSYANAKIRIFDIETGQVVMTLGGSDETYGGVTKVCYQMLICAVDGTSKTQINCIVAHPTMSLVVSGHEDKQIKFFDLKSGECAFSMPAHLDSVSCLDIDPSGTTLVSGGHDASIRLWDISMSKTCTQEFSVHRKKGDEGVLDVHYHRSFPWMVSGGADGIVKVYHHGH
ncbi:hypothetical protein DFQ29_005266 [Apophysomyces sp. BC1021]|nr:hypothetical protein DFQ29_005266 [Apophysomyces sp. BC1021]